MRKYNLDGPIEFCLCAFEGQQEGIQEDVERFVFKSLGGPAIVGTKELIWSRDECVSTELLLEALDVLDVVVDVVLAVDYGVNSRFLAADVDVVSRL